MKDAASRIHDYAWTGRAPGLERTRALLAELGNPERTLRFVHIAGSNGKGSTAAMIASVLTAAGLRTGLFTSPHLYRFNERFQVDGAPIPDDALEWLTQRVLAAADALPEHPTEFELMTAVGLLWFAEADCALVVLEVGLGGRLDSTNVIPAPEAAVITNIGLEHTELLGGTVAAIAAEKAGILKTGCRAVLYGQTPEAEEVVSRVCRERGIPLTVSDVSQLTVHRSAPDGQSFTYRGRGPLFLPLPGGYQLRNAAAALDAVDALRAARWRIPEEAVTAGLAQVKWPGRLELVRRSPDLIIDGGHNPQCAQALAASLRALYPGRKLVFLTGVLADKDWESMMREILPLAGSVVAVRPDSPRALDADRLAAWTEAQGVPAAACADLDEALRTALRLAGPNGAVCAWGSLYSVGGLRRRLGLYGADADRS